MESNPNEFLDPLATSAIAVALAATVANVAIQESGVRVSPKSRRQLAFLAAVIFAASATVAMTALFFLAENSGAGAYAPPIGVSVLIVALCFIFAFNLAPIFHKEDAPDIPLSRLYPSSCGYYCDCGMPCPCGSTRPNHTLEDRTFTPGGRVIHGGCRELCENCATNPCPCRHPYPNNITHGASPNPKVRRGFFSKFLP